MRIDKIKSLRSRITASDIVHAKAFLLEAGKTALDGFSKLSQAQQEMILAGLIPFCELRNASIRGVSRPTNMRRMRIEMGMSLQMLSARLRETQLSISEALLDRFEESPRPREDLDVEVVHAIESFFERGWEYLSAPMADDTK